MEATSSFDHKKGPTLLHICCLTGVVKRYQYRKPVWDAGAAWKATAMGEARWDMTQDIDVSMLDRYRIHGSV
jgi:hypothetical protein